MSHFKVEQEVFYGPDDSCEFNPHEMGEEDRRPKKEKTTQEEDDQING